VQLIPLGKVASYGQIADPAGLPRLARLVGNSISYAPKYMDVPWHRVLRSNGQIAFLKAPNNHKNKLVFCNKKTSLFLTTESSLAFFNGNLIWQTCYGN
jgi:alkylated DNA nucleotide flippase Atl1